MPSRMPALWTYLFLIPLGIYLLGWGVLIHQGLWPGAWLGGFLILALVVAALYLSCEGVGDDP